MLKQKKFLLFLVIVIFIGVGFYFRESIISSTVWRFKKFDPPTYEITKQKGLVISSDKIRDAGFVNDVIDFAKKVEANTIAIQIGFNDNNALEKDIAVIVNKAYGNGLYCELQLMFPDEYDLEILVSTLNEWSLFANEREFMAISLLINIEEGDEEKDLNQLIGIVKSKYDGLVGVIFPFVTQLLNVNVTQADRVEMMLDLNEVDEETFERDINFAVSNLTPTLIKDGKKEVIINVNSMSVSDERIETMLSSVYSTLHYRVDGFNTLVDPRNEISLQVMTKWYNQF